MQVWSTNNLEIVTYSNNNNNNKLSKLYRICWCFSWTNLNHPPVETHPPGSAMRSGAYWFCSPRLIPPNAIGCHPMEMSIGISMGFLKQHWVRKIIGKWCRFFVFCFLWIFKCMAKMMFASFRIILNVCVRFRLCPHGVHFRPCCETCYVYTEAYPLWGSMPGIKILSETMFLPSYCGSLDPVGCTTSGTRCGGSSGTFQNDSQVDDILT